jgi:hypothetical protein
MAEKLPGYRRLDLWWILQALPWGEHLSGIIEMQQDIERQRSLAEMPAKERRREST